MSDQPTTDATVASITPEALKDRIDEPDGDVFLLDVRSESDFAEWRIEGAETVNYPYFELLDGIPEALAEQLPEDRQITVLCAKGGSSEMIAENLQEAGYDVDHLERGMKGWARIYEYQELDVDADATVAQYRRPSSGCLAYFVADGDEAAVIDPLRAFTDEYVQDARALGVDLTYALDTHIHADHVSGIRALAAETGATPVLPEAADDRGVEYDREYETVGDGDTITVGDTDIEVLHTPGHTTGMTAYKVGDVLFTGDGLFTESVARPDLEDPDAAKDAARTLYESLQEQVLPLPDDTVIAPAHFSESATANDDGSYTAELGDLVDRMDALTMDEEPFVEFIVKGMPPRPANYEEIIAANLGREAPDDETAFELELGPNNCAASEEAMTD
ncbi:glyoxylase-like metal-dependent hydrolase (beta-lactamase superfamily II)/rhodanese-related sulfurtransferase [Halolamina salifodinae]|uniref:Glyoxylase-like metal-dependent hydrolase (Beta-lactamase superfamily II)/rhodanese-related sulfurtransferase n=2 Tax=Halolamina salifodinae TaxID=1202767 RepID=A0A8T4GWN5_9EURY|nr:MBL fold metallo-hydrolase [Halolamina salifodinae]MBP1986870.1 glyoxylase-like metal-dependent hydrolase (beta-lactamase superfamily II)/rhodanese-related sulfurtransferase [Halolamina salifodinae]